jgi:hypothetical protein
MSAMLTILDPAAPRGQGAVEHAFRPLDALSGKVVGFIDNSKPNFEYLVDAIAERLMAAHGVADVIKHRKLAASIPATEAILADVAARCDLVITGSGD